MRNFIFSAFIILFLSSCDSKTTLMNNLSEKDANDIIAELKKHDISTDKYQEKDGVTISIGNDNIENAVNILNIAGLPKKTKESFGEVFAKKGIISTPTEERARYVYALSQEVENTIAQIDGVVVARVHIVLPENIPPKNKLIPASAAVFIKYNNTLDPDAVEAKVKKLVEASIPGLSDQNPERVKVVFFPYHEIKIIDEIIKVGPFEMKPYSYKLSVRFFYAFCSLFIIVILFFFIKKKRVNSKVGL